MRQMKRFGSALLSGVAFVGAAQALAQNAGNEAGSVEIEEVIVTAQKRKERLLDVPQSVSVLDGDTLGARGITQLRDFASAMPGLNISTAGAGYSQISIRGVTSGVDVGQTVGIYVDDVPYGSSSVFGAASQHTLDVGLFDVERIEVLRGPQGTLYGASALGGVLKYVTETPDTAHFGTELRTGISDTRHGGVSYDGSAAVNLPIVLDKAALRVSGFYSRDGGYIDNAASRDSDANSADIYGGRLDFLLTPTERLGIRIVGFVQNIRRDGEGTVDYAFSGEPLYGELDQYRVFEEPYRQNFRLVSGTVDYDLGGADLTSITAYQTSDVGYVQDISPLYAPLLSFAGVFGGVAADTDARVEKFTEELRLSSRSAGILEWQVGGFYTHEDSRYSQPLVLLDAAFNPVPNTILNTANRSTLEEIAAFGNLTVNLSQRLALGGGLRYAHNSQQYEQQGSGRLGLSSPPTDSSEDVVTWMANARFRVNDRTMFYARAATGYRPGGPNVVAINPVTGTPFAPPSFESDELTSYEAGVKGETAGRSFSFDLAAYRIDWDDMHVSVTNGGFSAIGNAAGGARVNGVELSLTARPTQEITIGGAFAFQDAELGADEPSLGGIAGEALPNVPRFSASLTMDYSMTEARFKPSFGASVRYVDERTASFDGNPTYVQYRLPDYVSVDLRAGLSFEPVEVQLYVRNAFDEHGQLSAFNWRGTSMPSITQPQTIGLSLTVRL